jgi:amino acid adenylation domain-containing protein/non-ribosomal peptide synthase protein (TIGR01720 family)
MIREQEAPGAEPAIQDIYPLSPMQQGMLFHTLYAPDSAVYVEQFACTLEGDLDAGAFARAWQRVAERHAILRTAFLWEGVKEPHQVVFERVELPLERLDWRGLAAEEQRRKLTDYLAADRERGFDLLAPPLMRLTLIHAEERAWRFIWRFHHLLLDGWSGNLVLGEVFHLYESFRRGREPRLPPAPPFRDYIAWLGRQDLARAEAFWRRTLAGFTAPTPLVVDRPAAAPGGDEEIYGKRHTAFPEAETEALARLARSGQVTLNTLFEGAWALLLARYSREPEVVFGATSSGRPVDLPGVEGMVGLFVNTLPARVEVPLAAPLVPWLRTLQEQQAEMREYEYSPLAQVQAWSGVAAGTPLFESIQGLENYPVSRWGGQGMEGLTLSGLEAHERTNYPLTVLASPGGTMSLEIWFERRRFDAATIERMLGHLRTLLAGFLAGAGRRLGELPLLAAVERGQILAGEPAAPAPIAAGVQELFEAQVERTPEAVALLGEGEALTYGQVNALANRFAWRLRSLGVGAEDLVGVSAASPLRMVIAILGVLKAGAAYLPLDPGYPRERLAFILETACTRVLIADPDLLPLPDAGFLRLDAVAPADESAENPPAATGGAGAAYTIFTSGSTGRPKGIVVAQEALLHLSRSFVGALGLGVGDRLLMVPSLSFDASVGDLFPALLSGATLVVHPAPSELAAEGMLALCEELGITIVDIPAAFWNAWAEALAASPRRRDALSSLRLVIAGGESIAPERVERWAAATGRRVTFFGPYGPTEATVCTTAYATVDARELAAGAVRLPIGRPLPHARVRLLDAGLQPVPVLVPGEIFIGGPGLARGYLGRPDLTAEAFVPDPFAAAPGERLYRTGDLARRLPDGNLEFAGRVDQQVKVRGYRIETGEIEAALLRHPAVREAVVAAREDAPGEKRLVAYVVVEPEPEDAGFDPWQPLFEDIYAGEVARREETVAAALVNFAGWNSSEIGLPLPIEEMREWADRTAERILAPRPRRVLEIGCGTGLLLLRVAPFCEAYVGTDFSDAALGYLARVLERAGPPLPGVELRRRRADDWSGVEPGSFDAVVLNSVVQYFPGVTYLREVLRGAVAAVRPGGAIFLGDLRSLPLLAAFHAAVEASPAEAARRLALERELAVDPELFAALVRELPRIGRVEIQLKRGRARNELSRFRYDVTLHLDAPPAAPARSPIDWTAAGLDLAELRRRLAPGQGSLWLTGVPNPRLAGEGVEPEDLWELAGELGYELDAGWSDAGGPDRYDALFRRPGPGGPFLPPPGAGRAARPWSEYGNEPARRESARRLVPALRELLKRSLPDYMVPAAFVVLDALPVTPNGKVDRRALPPPDLERRDPGQGFVAPRTPAEEALAAIWGEVLGLARVGVTDNFFELGGDSILSIQIVSRAGQAGVPLTPRQIFEHQTIAALAAVAGTGRAVAAEQGAIAGEAPLTPIQRWFFALPQPAPHHWNQALLFELHEPFAPAVLARAVDLLLAHHDALRLRFRHEPDGVRQLHAAPGGAPPCGEIDLSALPEARRGAELTAAAAALQGSLDLRRGPLLRVSRFDLGPDRPPRLLAIVHHLAVDGVSWRILLEDLVAACRALARGEEPVLPAKTTSFQRWAGHLAARAGGEEAAGGLGYWLAEPRGRALRLPLDAPARLPGDNREGSARIVTVQLSPEETHALLREAAARARINDLLLTALAWALRRRAGSGPLVIDLEGHGRAAAEDVDLSRTVGWFTVAFPVLLELPEGAPAECLPVIEEQLRQVPGDGSGYGLLRYLDDPAAAARLAALPPAEVNFNYLGQLDQVLPEGSPLRPAAEAIGAARDPRGERRHLLEINAFVAGGRLRVDWSYGARLHRRETVEDLAAGFTTALAALIAPGGEIEDSYPLSPMQEGMLFQSLYAPGTGVYVQQLACTLRGALDPGALRQAWERTFARHPALRTFFVPRIEGRPLQVVRRQVELPWEEIDWRALAEGERRRRLEALAREDRQRGFDPSQAPLARLYLIRAGESEHRLLWSHHHLLMDGWCLPLVLGEVLSRYEALGRGEASPLAPVRPYRDYIEWIGRQDRAEAERFFRRTLAGFSAPTPLGIERSRTRVPGGSPGPIGTRLGRLDQDSTERLRALGRRRRVTLNTLLQGAWALLLARYAGVEDVVFGATVSGRPGEMAGIEEMVGMFVNTLPVRVAVPPRRLLAPWLQEIQAANLELRRYEATPLVDIQSWSGMPGGSPLFESLLAFENYPVDPSIASSGGSLALAGIETFERTELPLELLVIPGAALSFAVRFDQDRIDGDAAARLGEHLRSLLNAFSLAPERRIEDLPLLSPAERHQVLLEWNDTPGGAAPGSLLELLEAQAAISPEAPAVLGRGEALTYARLHARSNRIARRLRALGVGPGVRVAIYLERSPDVVLAILAAVKAGGVYVPIDPSYPADRLAFVLEDSGAAVLLSHGSLAERLPAPGPVARVLLDREGELPADDHPLPPTAGPEDLIYIIYTSGSTGRPKGAAIHQGAFLHLVRWHISEFGFTAADRFLIISSPGFDMMQKNFFAPLLCGARIVLADPGPYDPWAIAETVERYGATRLNCTPGAFYPLLEERSFPKLSSLRTVFLGGELLTAGRLVAWSRSGFRRAEVVNTYGPTECTDVSSFLRLPPLEETGPGPVPIGRPLPGFHFLVLDRDLSPLPVGVAGQLAIGGIGVGAGYPGRPGLTAAKFVPDPFSPEPGARLYWTGDLVRLLRGGVIEFVGRADHQVKLRGFRIELGEVEAALASCPGVKEAVALVREDPPGGPRLIAYCVPRPEGWGSTADLRRRLARHLPEFMVPSAILELAAFPLTAHGKVDRLALPAPATVQEPAAADASRSLFEGVITGIWAGVLGVADFGTGDSFFDIGGHSLLATQVISRLRSAFGIDLPLRALFDSPTVEGLARRIETEMRAGGAAPLPPIERALRSGPLPLSYTQLRLWFLHRLAPDSPAYNLPMGVRFAGGLDVAAMAASLGEVTRRHESLRTVFRPAPAGEPEQAVLPTSPARLPVVDLAGLPEESRRGESGRLTEEEARRPFDLGRGPLLRCVALRLGATEHVLLVSFHHIVCDGWSLQLFEAELTALYEACRAGLPSPLPEPTLQYADFAVWQRRWLQGESLESQLAYWKRQLHDLPPPLSLPMAGPRPALTGTRGALRRLRLGETVAAGVRTLARAEGCTPFIVLLAGLQALLCRYSGQTGFCVGTPIAGRSRMETEGLIGCFLNTLALRADLAGDPAFRHLLGRVRETSLGAYAHQDLPFERLLEELQPERDLRRAPVFQVLFNLLNVGGPRPGEDRPAAEAMAIGPKLDLSVHAVELEADFEIELQYDADLFDAPQMEVMAEHLQELLAGAVSLPDRRISDLPLRSPALQPTRADAPTWADGSLAERFRRVAGVHAKDLAVATADHRWSYGTLDRLSDRAALALVRQAGDSPRVALLFPQGAPRIAAVLAVLKAGKTCVPLDPSDPPARLAAVLRDAEAGAILAAETALDLARGLAAGKAVLTLDLADGGAVPAAELPTVPPETPAYILYTSGSTGEPKGVVQSHRNVLGHIRTYADALGITPADRLTLLSSYTFDAAVMDLFGALLFGASLFPFDVRREGTAAIARWMRGERITVYHSTPTLYRRFLDELEDEVFPDVRRVVLGGERCLRRDLERSRARFPPESVFVNGLGPTESTLALQFFAPAGTVVDRETVPVGRPVAGTAVLLRNAAGEQAAVYGSGEIEIRGPWLALGYWRRPELTAAAFADGPEGGRIYRTGDLGRWLPDGGIEFAGRSDSQVKVRGHRVELGEVEAALNALPGVREAVVLAREDRRTGEPRLAAYLLAPAGEAADPRWLRQALGERLPEPMIPADFVAVEAWPLTSTGKIDRQALPEPPAVRPAPRGVDGEPGTPLEELLCGLWAEVLGLERVGVDDDFFALGGHSLLATQLLSRIRQVGAVEMPLRAVFEAPTAAAMAGRLERAWRAGAAAAEPPPPIVPVPRGGTLPLSFGQQRFWFLERLQPGTAAYNLPAGILLAGSLEIPALAAALAEVARRHEVLRTTFRAGDGDPVQAIAPAGPVPLPVRDLSALPPELRRAEAGRLAGEEARRAFDLERGPLFRAELLRLDAGEHALLVSFHHAVTDGWSQGIFRRELAVLYGAFARRLPSPLAELPIQYADFASWQRGWLAGEILDAQLAYWRWRLLGAPPRLELPLDRPRPAFSTSRGGGRPLDLPAPLSTQVRDLGRRTGTTPFMILLAAFQAVLARHAGMEDLCVGTPVAGRTRVELEGLIGLFVNTLVMRGELAGDPAFGELLRRTRDSALQAHAHQDLPFERLVEELKPERSLDASPLFQVMLAFQNVRRDPPPSLPGLQLGLLPAATGTVKFDLSLTLSEVEGCFAGTAEYAAELFDAATIDRLLGHLTTLLAAAVASPGLRLSELPLLGPGERHQLLVEWSDTAAADRREERALHELVLAQAARTPEAVAVIAGGERLTYRDLDARSARLAARLAGAGIGGGAFVPVLLEGGADLVVAFLGILRAGAAFVPLDPAWPAERRNGVLEEIGDLARGVVVDRELLRTDGDPEAAPATTVPPESPVYAIYTSGSTGRPKGVVVPHRGIVNRFLWMDRFLGGAAARSVLQTTRLVYDSVIWQLFWPLTHGGATVLTDPDRGADPDYLRGLIEEHGITLVDFVPSVFSLLVERLGEETAARLGSLQAVIVGGEEMTPAAARRFRGFFPSVSLVNLYGPTEASIGCIYHRVAADGGAAGRVPIGRPISNVHPVVLDRWGSPAPVGVPGELCLSGRCLGLGYLRDGERTAGSFVPNPLPEISCDRLYRTGDLARLLPNGEIDFLGRIDRQVKIRGVRIELGEIEAALRRHPGVAAAAVLVWPEGGEARDRLLAACFVGVAGGAPSGDELREHLRERLPATMVPALFVALEALPLTPGGKVDRRALVGIVAGRRPAAGGPRVPPRDELELRLVRIWEDLLQDRHPGVTDDFFALGGHSMIAVRLLARVRAELGQDLPLSVLFQHSTVEGLAAVLRRSAARTERPVLVEIQAGRGERPLFLVHPVGGNVLCYLDLARALSPERPVYGLQAPDPEAAGSPGVEGLARRYLEAVRAVQPRGPYALGAWSMGGLIAFEMARRLAAAGERVAPLLLIDAQAPRPGAPPPADPVAGFAHDLAASAGLRVALPDAPPEAGPEERLTDLHERALAAGLLPPELGPGELRRLFSLFRSNTEAVSGYAGGTYGGEIVLFRAARPDEPSLGWNGLAAGGLEVRDLAGDHYSILRRPAVEDLAREISYFLTRSETDA